MSHLGRARATRRPLIESGRLPVIGSRLAQYEIVGHLGTGGMGEVFQATDTRLGRSVAIKFLPEAFAHDAERVGRFEREARVLASLTHSNIATIHGIDEANGRKFLVMELVAGETIADRLARGPIPLEDALPLAKQLADALEAAHDKGIVHRDLKPANIKITPDGQVKVLDFGLAKAVDTTQGSGLTAQGNLSNSPTMTTPAATAMGVVLGTAAYMSPEQAKGRPTDRTTDMWAFGCVLYEMLTARPVFEGESIGEILGSIFKTEPDWTRLPADTPASVRRLLRRCLQKDRALRLKDAGDARLEIVEAHADAVPTTAAAAPSRRERLAWIAAVVLLAAVAGVMAATGFRTPPAPAEVRLDIAMPPSPTPAGIAVSPDGKRIVFRGERQQLWVRSFDSTTANPLAGTTDGNRPFWSADSQSIGFFAESKLRRIAADGGQARDLANAFLPRGGTWNRDNVILFVPRPNSPIMKVSSTGGEATPVTTVGPEHLGHYAPQFLPDGRHFLYYVMGSPDTNGVHVGDLSSSETRHVLKTESAAVYASSSLLYLRQGELVAQPFDPDRLTTTGDAVVVARGVAGSSDTPAIAAADGGPIVFRAASGGGGGTARSHFAWFDRSGKEIARVGEPVTGFGRSPSLSPDGRHVAYTRVLTPGQADIWLLETNRGVLSRFTFEKGDDLTSVWSPDGGRIVFGSNRRDSTVNDLYEKRLADAAGSEQLLLTGDQSKSATDWSRDGNYLLYSSVDPKSNSDIWAMRMNGDRPSEGSGRPEPVEGRKPFPVVQTDFQEGGAVFSPDGRWIAYQSNKSGRPEIYLQPFPGPGAEVQVSTTGGSLARWRRDGKEIFYIGPDDRLMAVSIRPAPTGSTPELATPVTLFQANTDNYSVAPDGQRFLLYLTSTPPITTPLSVILNWKLPGDRGY